MKVTVKITPITSELNTLYTFAEWNLSAPSAATIKLPGSFQQSNVKLKQPNSMLWVLKYTNFGYSDYQ